MHSPLMNTKGRGEHSEAQILARVVENGYAPSIPFGNNQRYDLVLDDGRQLLRVQCKTAWIQDGCVTFQTASKNGFTGKRRDYKGQIDLFLVYCPKLRTFYKIPVEKAPITEMRLRVEAPGRKSPRSTINWAKDYLF